MNKAPIVKIIAGFDYYEIYFHEGRQMWHFEHTDIGRGRYVYNTPLDGSELEIFPELKGTKRYEEMIAWNVSRRL